jgi:hypothetical protein
MLIRVIVFFSLIFICNGCATIYMPTTKIPTGFTHKNDFTLTGEISPHYFASSFAITPVEHFYLHGEVASFNDNATNNIYSYGLGAYKLLDSTDQIEVQVSFGKANFNYGDPIDGSDYELTSAEGNSKIYSCFFSYSSIHPKITNSFVVNVGNISVHYDDCDLKYLIGTTQYSFHLSAFYVAKFRLANNLKAFVAPGFNYLSNGETIRYNPVSLRFGFEIKLR